MIISKVQSFFQLFKNTLSKFLLALISSHPLSSCPLLSLPPIPPRPACTEFDSSNSRVEITGNPCSHVNESETKLDRHRLKMLSSEYLQLKKHIKIIRNDKHLS